MSNLNYNKNGAVEDNVTDISSLIHGFPNALFAVDIYFKEIYYNQQCADILINNNFITDDAKTSEFITSSIIPFLKNQLLLHNINVENIQDNFKITFSINNHKILQISVGRKIKLYDNFFYLISLQLANLPLTPENTVQSVSHEYAELYNCLKSFENCGNYPDVYTTLCQQLSKNVVKSVIGVINICATCKNKTNIFLFREASIDVADNRNFELWMQEFMSENSLQILNNTKSCQLQQIFPFNNYSQNCAFRTNSNIVNIGFKNIKNVFCIKIIENTDISDVIFIATEELISQSSFSLIEIICKIAIQQVNLLKIKGEMRKTKEISNQFIDLNPYPIAMSDGEGYFIYANKAFSELWGGIPGKEYNIINDPILKSFGIIEKIKKLANKEVEKLEVPPFWYNPHISNPNFPDSNRCVEANVFNITDIESGKTQYFVVMQHDITEKELINQKLQQSEEKYRKIFEQIQDVYFEVDHQNIIREISPSVELYTQYKREEILNTSFMLYLAEPERMTEFFENIFKFGRVRDSEIKILDKNREIIICASNCILVPSYSDNQFMIIGSLMNITDLKKTQTQLIEVQYKYSEILNNIGQGIGILDETETFVFANPAANQIFEVIENGLTGNNISAFVDGEQLDIIRQQTEERKKGLRSIYSLKISTPQGKTKYIQLTANPQYDENNNFCGSLGVFQDITESQFLQQELIKSEEKYREIFENANDIIYTMDLNGNFTSINPIAEKILGYTTEEIKQIHLERIVDSTDYHLSQNSILEAVKRQEQHSRHEIDAYTKNGEKVVFDINSFLKFKDGKPYEIFGIARDITARKMAEQKMRDALAEKEVLLREVHHRVKNNLQVIMSLINFQITDDLENNVKEKLKELRERIRTMSLIHEDLYISEELAKVEFGVYLEKLINNVSNVFDAEGRGIAILLETKVVIMDIEKAIPCGMIVNEMLSNALKYAFPADWRALQPKEFTPVIKISFKISKGIYALTFEDNGIGMPEKIEKKKKTTLGLWLINILTKDQLNGKLTINRKNGTKFSIKFLKIQEKPNA